AHVAQADVGRHPDRDRPYCGGGVHADDRRDLGRRRHHRPRPKTRAGGRPMSAEPHVPSYWAETPGPEPAGGQPRAGGRRPGVPGVGGGYSGLAAALRLAGNHGLETVLLEAHRIGWGASGRNGGFAGITLGKVGLAERIQKWGLETARRTVAVGVEAVETV